ncbi:unnamed protein product [Rotaria socialis]|uniref:Peptidase S1 domain-containing protein n=1 Tax=Rotaria socialis TaxID=392032 RepID=A0A818A7J7_9BILA|nr:unnamed protein product [Rotaria socialis]CAF3400306.1 unnamed protein product [Rotaria socialis]CAF3583261.1 unnamed protein product [Rotaria socialis]CAF3754876.1 unnamed protein product [Rotaria socialis]
MNNQIPNISHSSVLSEYCSKKRRCIAFILIIFTNLLVTTVLLVALASIKPCFFMKCHSKASGCINRSLFKGQCICDSRTAGNGRTVCDGCGITYLRRDARIIGGIDAIQYSWPFAVLIRQHYKTILTLNDRSHLVSASWMCGGTLINHKTILTAAHCLKKTGDKFDYTTFAVPILSNEYYPTIESTLEVSIGLYDRRKTTQRRIAKVLQVILHPYYNERHLLNDIAILKLEDYLRPSPTIQFACLPYLLSEINTTGIAVGFGDTVPGANQGSSVLKQTHLTIYPNEFCNHVSPSTKKNWNTQLCCGDLNGERDTCQGDSGGGLYTQRNLSNILHYSVDGIVSYGERCASPMKPGIYTRVSNYIDWIQENSDFDTIDS